MDNALKLNRIFAVLSVLICVTWGTLLFLLALGPFDWNTLNVISTIARISICFLVLVPLIWFISWVLYQNKKHRRSKVNLGLNLAAAVMLLAALGVPVHLMSLGTPHYSPHFFAFLPQAETIGPYEIKAMYAANTDTPAQAALSVDGRELTIPLPDGAVQFANGTYPPPENEHQYLVRVSSYQAYEDKMWASNQMTEQMGSGFTLQDPKTGISYQLYIAMFTQDYRRIIYPAS